VRRGEVVLASTPAAVKRAALTPPWTAAGQRKRDADLARVEEQLAHALTRLRALRGWKAAA
jgi:hypothetical protein